jgi:hypothetical protein
MPARPTVADHRLELFQLPRLLRAVQQDIVPVGRIEILDRLDLQPGRVDLPPERGQLLIGPQPVRIAGQPPAGVVADRLVARRLPRDERK